MLNNKQISSIIVMRGLGYTQQEIADELKISRRTVTSWLRILKRESKSHGIYRIYCLHIDIVYIILNKIKEEFKKKEENLKKRRRI